MFRQPGAGGERGSGMVATPRIVVVSNRLPVERVGRGAAARWQASPGGLVSALEPIMRRHGGAWVGWNGATGKPARPSRYDGFNVRPLALSPRDVETFYHGFSNRTLWPLYHDAIHAPEFRREWWAPYLEVNRRFPRATAAAARPGDLVWVHDYHLQLVPRLLRALRPDLRIGFFLHIPFPPEELFAWLPWRSQVLEGILGADIVGFQTHAFAQNFSRSARALTSAEGSDTRLLFE